MAKESIIIHGINDFIGMRKAGKLCSQVLDYITPFVQIGITTDELNTLCHNYIIEHKATPAPLNYLGFPKSICTSLNHVVCHGIPGERKLVDGDILNIDVTVILDGYYGDSSRMFKIGKKVPIKAAKLIDITYECMMRGIEQVRPGVKITSIGRAIQELAFKNGFSVVKDFTGHGLGKVFHAAPTVFHYYEPSYEVILEEGMFFTIEPMINAGRFETKILQDGWTAVTRDKSLSAQYEHSLAVTKDGCEIFTIS